MRCVEKAWAGLSISEPVISSERVFSINPDQFFLIILLKPSRKRRKGGRLTGQSLS